MPPGSPILRALSFPGAQRPPRASLGSDGVRTPEQGLATDWVEVTSDHQHDGRAGGGRGGLAGPGGRGDVGCCNVPGVLEILLVMVSVEDGEAEHAAGNLLSLLLQLGQVLLGIICKRPGG